MDAATALLLLAANSSALALVVWAPARLRLSRAKHRSLAGHSRWSRRLARWMPAYTLDDEEFFRADGAPDSVAQQRERGFERLGREVRERQPRTLALSFRLHGALTDVALTDAYRVPFPFRRRVLRDLPVGLFADATEGGRVRDLDGEWRHDLTGSYGVNLFGYDVYKECIARAIERVGDLGPILGTYHPVVADNVERLRAISGLDEVSFHMSGTEAVMQAVRLARFHTGRSHLVRFCGAYHGWWDGVQPGVGNARDVRDVYTLADMSERSLGVLRTRDDIACVLVNPLQALHPNKGAPGDGSLLSSNRSAGYDKDAWVRWLRALREVCSERGIVLILDEVFLGFRVARGGVQEYAGVQGDLVTYGKSLGGGLPVGVVCGRRDLMRRHREDRPADLCFARGTFNAHPYVMAAMNEFLRRLDQPEFRRTYRDLDYFWDTRAERLNAALAAEQLPVRVANMTSVFTTLYTAPGQYNWMLQFYLRSEGLLLSWIGTGRFIFSHRLGDEDFEDIVRRFVDAARAMHRDGFFWSDAELTEQAIKRRLGRRLLHALRRKKPAPAPAVRERPQPVAGGLAAAPLRPSREASAIAP